MEDDKAPTNPTQSEARWQPYGAAISATLMLAMGTSEGIRALGRLPASDHSRVFEILLCLLLSWSMVIVQHYVSWWGSSRTEHGTRRMALGCLIVFILFAASVSMLFGIMGELGPAR